METRAELGAGAKTRQEEIDELNDLAWGLRYREIERAQALSERAYELSSTNDFLARPYGSGQAASLTTQAYLNRHQGRLDLALDQCFRALALLDLDKPTRAAIDCLRIVSWIYYFLGDNASALSYGLQALKFAKALNLRTQEASVLDNLAMIHSASGDPEQAILDHQNALEAARQAGDATLESVVLNNSAIVLLKRGEDGRARELGMASLEIASRLGLDEQQVAASDTLGQIMLKSGDYSGAESILTGAVNHSIETKRELGQAYCLLSLGNVCLAQQDLARAESILRQSMTIAEVIGARPVQMECLEKLCRVSEQRGDWQQALEYQKRFHSTFQEVNSESANKRLAILKVVHQVETAKRDAEIYYLRNEELVHEIEERKRMELALQELAMTDPLTGLHNRRHFFLVAKTLVEHSIRYMRPLSLLMLDIDHFKKVNDTYGHSIGDDAIKFLAAGIRRSIRSVDIAARFGGDEFVILLPESPIANAARTADRIRTGVAESILSTDHPQLRLTLSLGIASFVAGDAASTIDALLEHADRALYAAKQAGRNQTKIYSQAMEIDSRAATNIQ